MGSKTKNIPKKKKSIPEITFRLLHREEQTGAHHGRRWARGKHQRNEWLQSDLKRRELKEKKRD